MRLVGFRAFKSRINISVRIELTNLTLEILSALGSGVGVGGGEGD